MIGIPTKKFDPTETLILKLDDIGNAEQLAETLAGAFENFNWRTHFYLMGSAGAVDVPQAEVIIETAAKYLRSNRFVTYFFHPFLEVGEDLQEDIDCWQRLLDLVRPFAEDAFEQQSEARLLVLPILIAGAGCEPKRWIAASEYFRSQFAKPSVIFSGADARERAAGAKARAGSREIRFYVNDSTDEGQGYTELLWRNLMFEQLLERIEDTDQIFSSTCAGHLLLDETGLAYDCLRNGKQGNGGSPAPDLLKQAGQRVGHYSDCTGCYAAAMTEMAEDLKVNDSTAEGRRVHSRLGLILSDTGMYNEAITQMKLAAGYSTDNVERTNCLITEGMCRLKLGELQEAEDVLARAAELADDKGLVAYNRGLVQFEWHDYIEALDRFEEALEFESGQIPRQDLFFYMAVCHINIEEFPEAGPYLQQLEDEGGKLTVVSFYRGLCELGEGKTEEALACFVKSVDQEPAEEDLGRVLFYQGHCFKELEKYEGATESLQKAQHADPEDGAIPSLLGFCYYKLKQHEAAVACFKRVIELDPKSAMDYASLGSNLRELGRLEEAIEMYQKALALDPNIEFARQNIALLTERIENT
jgi:tetratricopeptide (TPR) repeat protein